MNNVRRKSEGAIPVGIRGLECLLWAFSAAKKTRQGGQNNCSKRAERKTTRAFTEFVLSEAKGPKPVHSLPKE